MLTGFRGGRVSTPSGGVGGGAGGVAAVNDRAAVVAVNGGPDNDAMMVVAAKLLHGDVAGGVGWAAVACSESNVFAGEGVFFAAGVAFDNPPETNVSNMNVGLEVENNVRGWALAAFTVRVVVGK
jgi:hypothetical protein